MLGICFVFSVYIGCMEEELSGKWVYLLCFVEATCDTIVQCSLYPAANSRLKKFVSGDGTFAIARLSLASHLRVQHPTLQETNSRGVIQIGH